jgi:hypothetical protein
MDKQMMEYLLRLYEKLQGMDERLQRVEAVVNRIEKSQTKGVLLTKGVKKKTDVLVQLLCTRVNFS